MIAFNETLITSLFQPNRFFNLSQLLDTMQLL